MHRLYCFVPSTKIIKDFFAGPFFTKSKSKVFLCTFFIKESP